MRTTRFRISGGAGGGGIPGDCPPTVTFVDSLAVTDDLTVKWILPFLDTFGMTEDALGVKVELYDTAGLADALLVVAKGYFGDTFGMDDRLTLADINAFFLDTFGMDDALTAKIVATYVDTLGIDDRLTLATLKGFFADTFGVDDRLTLVTMRDFLVDTFGINDAFAVTVVARYVDSFGVDDRLTLVTLKTFFINTFAVTDNLGVTIKLNDTLGVTDNLNPTVKPTNVDTFGMDDRLTLATVKPVHLDTFGITENLIPDVFANHPDTFGVADHFLGVKPTLQETTLHAVLLPGGTPDNRLTTPDSAVLSITGDIDIRVAGWLDDWTPSSTQALVSKFNGTSNQRAYELTVLTSGLLRLRWSSTGADIFLKDSTVAVPVTDGQFFAVRATLDIDDGAGNNVVKFFTKQTSPRISAADLRSNTGWTQLGATVTTAVVVSIFNSTSELHIGARPDVQIEKWVGGFTACIIKNGIDGTTVFDLNMFGLTNIFQTSFTETANSAVVTLLTLGRPSGARLGPVFGFMDHLSFVDVAETQLDTSAFGDGFSKAQIREAEYRRSATPDTDPGGDTVVSQATPTTPAGASAPNFFKGKATLANDEVRALVEIDFTRFAGMNAYPGGLHRIFLKNVTNPDLLLSVDITMELSRLAARPFTESTVTWNTMPAAGTVIKSQTGTIPANSTIAFAMTLTDAQMNDLLGDWAYVRMTSPGAVTPIAVNFTSREGAPGNVWTCDLDLVR